MFFVTVYSKYTQSCVWILSCKHTHLFEMMCHLNFSRYTLFNYKYVHIIRPNVVHFNKFFFFFFFLSFFRAEHPWNHHGVDNGTQVKCRHYHPLLSNHYFNHLKDIFFWQNDYLMKTMSSDSNSCMRVLCCHQFNRKKSSFQFQGILQNWVNESTWVSLTQKNRFILGQEQDSIHWVNMNHFFLSMHFVDILINGSNYLLLLLSLYNQNKAD